MLKKLFQESEEIPPDYTRLFNSRLFSISTTVRTGELLMMIYVITMMTTIQAVPRAIQACKELGVKHEPLRFDWNILIVDDIDK